jgi:hypothetical protein
MATTNKEPLLFARVTHGAMIVGATGLLTTVAYGMGDPMLRLYAQVLLGWIMIALAAFGARIAASWVGTIDAKITEIESAAQQQ